MISSVLIISEDHQPISEIKANSEGADRLIKLIINKGRRSIAISGYYAAGALDLLLVMVFELIIRAQTSAE